MEHSINLHNVVILLAAAVFIVSACRLLRLSPVLGYLAAGAVIGPSGMAIIDDSETTSAIASLGVVFLLFIIGLELSFQKLREMRWQKFVLGLLQVIITSSVIVFICKYFGFETKNALVIGGALALSSTAVVLEVLHNRKEESTQSGRLALGVLLMQDMAVIPILVLLPLLISNDTQNIMQQTMFAIGKGVAAAAVIAIIGFIFIRPLYKLVAMAHSSELFSAFTLFIVLGTAYATEELGLSMALGAFIAGLLVAETQYHHQVMAEINPFKGLLLGLFFMTVGMSLNLPYVMANLWDIIGLCLGLIAVKAAIIFALAYILKFRSSFSIQTALLLSGGGEFAFIIFKLAGELGLIESQISQKMMVVVTTSMALTPLLAWAGGKLSEVMEKRFYQGVQDIIHESQDMANHVIIAGFGRVGQMVAGIMAAETIPFAATDLDPRVVSDARKRGIPVFYGDSTRHEILESVGLERARCFLVTVNEIKAATQLVETVKRLYPHIPIIARARDEFHAETLRKAGASIVVPEALEASLQIGGAVMVELGFEVYEISRVLQQFRLMSLGHSASEKPA